MVLMTPYHVCIRHVLCKVGNCVIALDSLDAPSSFKSQLVVVQDIVAELVVDLLDVV